MTVTTNPVTADQLLEMPDDGLRHELVRGEVTTMSPPMSEHGQIVALLTGLLLQQVRSNRSGRVFTGGGFLLHRNPDTVREPDVAFVRQEALDRVGSNDGYWPGAPDLAVEVISPNDRYTEVDEKVQEYLEAGARLVWIVNPRRQSITVRTQSDVKLLGEADSLGGGDVVPGFVCAVREIFAF
jgi:Uma2 family endonuclease